MADKRPAIVLPSIPVHQMLSVMAALCGDSIFGDLLKYDARLHIAPTEGTAQLIFPQNAPGKALSDRRQSEIRQTCADFLNDIADTPSGRAAGQAPASMVDFETLHTPYDALLTLVFSAAQTDEQQRLARTKDQNVAAIYPIGMPFDDLPSEVAKTIKSGLDANIVKTAAGMESSGHVVTFISDDSARLSTFVAPLPGYERFEGIQILTQRRAVTFDFWLPFDQHLDQRSLDNAGRFAVGLQRHGALDSKLTDGFMFYGRNRVRALFTGTDTEPISAAELATTMLEGQPLELTILEVQDHETALAELERKLTADDFNFGYRVRLAQTKTYHNPTLDKSRIVEKITELENELQLIDSLGNEQQHLLRFTDAQLPAMIDGLRAFPRDVLAESGTFLYAASHSTHATGPSHYLLYNPATTPLRQLIPEHFWRGRTEDRPISYWMDPFVAGHTQNGQSRSRVFVPMGQMIIPAFTHFSGSVDKALDTIIGKQFPEHKNIRDDDTKQPIYLFLQSPDPDVDLEIEILDRAQFGDLKTQLRWINDYLTVHKTKSVKAEDLAAVADGVYANDTATAINAKAADSLQSMRDVWETQSTLIAQEAGEVLTHLGAEIDAASSSIQDAYAFLDASRDRIHALESAVASAHSALSNGEQALENLPEIAKGIEAVRDDFLDRVRLEFDTSQQTIDASERELDRITERLKSVSRWGRRQ